MGPEDCSVILQTDSNSKKKLGHVAEDCMFNTNRSINKANPFQEGKL